MDWLESIILGLVQGLTEFLPVSSSGHLMIAKELLGVTLPDEGTFLSFEITVHAATVCATIVVFRKQILDLLKGLVECVRKSSYNDQTDYVLKICVSMIPVFIVGMFFKEQVEGLFSGLGVVGIALMTTAVLLFLSDVMSKRRGTSGVSAADGRQLPATQHRNGISWLQAFIVGVAQAVAVIPGLSRSGTTISTGLLCGVKRGEIAGFSFLMVLVPILGECFLDLVGGGFAEGSAAIGTLPLALGFISAFISGLFACKVMIALVKKASLKWFALYCAAVGLTITVFNLLG